MSLPFVHTARRCYRLNGLVSFTDWGTGSPVPWEVNQTWSFRGSKSRNKVSVGEPAEGSLTRIHVSTLLNPVLRYACRRLGSRSSLTSLKWLWECGRASVLGHSKWWRVFGLCVSILWLKGLINLNFSVWSAYRFDYFCHHFCINLLTL